MMKYGHDVAQICLNGHVINASTINFPEFNKKYCDKCGAQTITTCQHCNAQIRGDYHIEGVIGGSEYQAPAFCHNCGKAYPWTEARIKAAQDMAKELENISDEEKKILSQSIDEIVKDTPGTTLAATRFKKIVSRAGKAVADGFRDILVDIVSETAKKLIWPEK